MFKYKILPLSVNECEETPNLLAKEGWKLITMAPNQAKGIGDIATMEKN